MSEAPTQRHRDLWVKLMRGLQSDMRAAADASRQVIKTGVGIDDPDDESHYEIRAWAAEQLLESLRAIPTPSVADWGFPEEVAQNVSQSTYPTPHENEAQWLEQGPVAGLPTVTVGGVAFHRKVCDADVNGDCYGVACPQRDPATRQQFCPLPRWP